MKKMNARVWKTSVALIFSLTLIFPAMGFAEYPEKPITAYYGYKTGGACYISFNALIKGAMEVLGETIVMKEKAGATATICAGTVSKAKPDGYTIGIIKSTTITNAPFVYKLPYDSFNDLTFIYAYAGPAGGFVVNAENPATTWEEFLENVRQNPWTCHLCHIGQHGGGAIDHGAYRPPGTVKMEWPANQRRCGSHETSAGEKN